MQPFLQEMIERKWLGDKTGQGCYHRVGKEKEIHAHRLEDAGLSSRSQAPLCRNRDRAADRNARPSGCAPWWPAGGRAGKFLWQVLSDLMIYSAIMVPEISDRIVEIDRAMRWGYANTLGPFEMWDALGFMDTVHRIESEGRALPQSIERMCASGATSFYQAADTTANRARAISTCSKARAIATWSRARASLY